jgi:hypothetical protein
MAMAEHSKTKIRKDKIREAALRIFAGKGFHDAVITEKSEQAGVYIASIRAILRGYIHCYETNQDYSGLVLLHLTLNKRFRQTKTQLVIRDEANMLLGCIRDDVFKLNVNP